MPSVRAEGHAVRRFAQLTAALLLSAALLCLAPRARAEKGDTVRVGFYPVLGYQEAHADGTYSGFSYDYYIQLQKYTGWQYEFVEASYAKCMAMLADGEIDLISGVIPTEARRQSMAFSHYSNSNTQNELYARGNDDALYYDSFDAFDGCRVALLKGTLTDELDDYCAGNGFSLVKVPYESMAEMEAALASGEVELLYTSSVSDGLDSKIVTRFDKVPLYYAVSLEKPEVLAELNRALKSIADINPNFYTQLSEKYMISGVNAAATFTREELDYIGAGRPISVILNADWAPVSWRDAATGQFRGICVDVLDRIAEYSGLQFECYTADEFAAASAADPSKTENVVAVLADDSAWAVKQGVMMSNHITNSPVVLVTKKGTTPLGDDLRVAMPRGFYISWRVQADLAAGSVTEYDTVQACLDAINAGRADATYVNQLEAAYYLSELNYSNLFATADSGYNENLAFAVNAGADNPLLGILDKCILCIGSDELEHIILQNSMASESRLTLRGLFYAQPVAVAAAALAMVVLVSGGVIVLVVSLSRKKQLTTALAQETQTKTMRTTFFTMMSHELRTPLNAVVGYLTLAEDGKREDPASWEYVRRAKESARQLETIANDMLDYTQITGAGVHLREEPVDLAELVRTVAETIAPEAERKRLDFRVIADSLTHEFVLGDPARLSQVLLNLLSNAVKFTSEGGRIELIAIENAAANNCLAVDFEVVDNGKGMSEEFLQRIYAPFTQSDEYFSRKHGGLGLGLFLTKFMVDAMHGHLEVSSTLGLGSRFGVHLELPRADSDQILEKHVDYSRVHALIGARDPEDAELLCTMLRRLKIRCDVADSAALLERRARTRAATPYAYQLCFVDAVYFAEEPQLSEALRALPGGGPKLLVLCAEAANGRRACAEAAELLVKPLVRSELFNAVIRCAGAYQPAHSGTKPLQTFAGRQVLVIEDNAVNANILTRLLARMKIEATVAENGLEGADRFIQSAPGTFDMVLMDIQMPVMNGYDATRAIRASNHPQAVEVPIIAVSANAFPEDIEFSLEAGMNEHLSKPIDCSLLQEALARYLSDAQGSAKDA